MARICNGDRPFVADGGAKLSLFLQIPDRRLLSVRQTSQSHTFAIHKRVLLCVVVCCEAIINDASAVQKVVLASLQHKPLSVQMQAASES
jgi:hypothetical protein